MLQAMKTENNIANNKIIDFPTNKVLENYLKKFIISKEVFSYDILADKEDFNLLERYYKDSYEHAETLVMDDEYVGITFENLDRICKILKK